MEGEVDAETRELVEALYFSRGAQDIGYVATIACIPQDRVFGILDAAVRRGMISDRQRKLLTPEQMDRVLGAWDRGERDIQKLAGVSQSIPIFVAEYLKDLKLAGIIETEPQYTEQDFSGGVGGEQYLGLQQGGRKIALPAALEAGAEKPETGRRGIVPHQYLKPDGDSHPYVSPETEGYQHSGPILVSLPQASRKRIKLSKGEIDTATFLRGESWMLADIAWFLGRSKSILADYLKKAGIERGKVIGVMGTEQEAPKRAAALALYFERGATGIKYVSDIVRSNITTVGRWIREELKSGRRPSMYRRGKERLLGGREKRKAIELLKRGVHDPVAIRRAVGVHRGMVEALVEDLRIAGEHYELEGPERQKMERKTPPTAAERAAPLSGRGKRVGHGNYLKAAAPQNRTGASSYVSTPPPEGFPLGYRVVTLQDMTEALKRERKMGEEDAEKTAETILNFFGFQDCIIDNALTAAERDVFYALRGEGEERSLLTTEEEVVSRGGRKGWIIKYWKLNKAMIFREQVEERVVPEEEAVYRGLDGAVFAEHAKRSKAASS